VYLMAFSPRLQWIKKYFETHYGGHPYDAVERRGGAPAGAAAKENTAKSSSSASAAAPRPRPAARAPARDVSNTAPVATASRPGSTAAGAAPASKSDENRRLNEELTSLKFTVEKVRAGGRRPVLTVF
jgi:hypothetical protein